MSRLGDVMNVALPSSLKLASESKIIVHPNFDGDMGELNDKEYDIYVDLFNNMMEHVQPPTLMVYLRIKTENVIDLNLKGDLYDNLFIK